MKAMPYDYLIVGSGLYGATFARMAKQDGKRCLVIDKREHLGGNTYCEKTEGIIVHKYGPHVFHTSDQDVWDFVNSFVKFNRFTLTPIANYNGELYNLPFNMNTFYQMWGVNTPFEAASIIDQQKYKGNVTNLEEQAKALVGVDIYEKLIKGYTEKQWGRCCADLPPFLIRRLPLRFTFNNNYFDDKYQGVPIGGYNKLIEEMLKGIECKTHVDFFDGLNTKWRDIANTLVYTGKIDEYYNYCCGKLQYRSLRFETDTIELSNFQGVAQMNYTDEKTPYTRIIEHKHFDNFNCDINKNGKTVITREYPKEHSESDEPYYPINDVVNQEIFEKYLELSNKEVDVVFGGRLADYCYYNMDEVIRQAKMAYTSQIVP